MRKFFAKLVNWQAQRDDNAEMIHSADQHDQAKLSREREDQIMKSRGSRKYVSEISIPSEDKITGPTDSKPKESQD